MILLKAWVIALLKLLAPLPFLAGLAGLVGLTPLGGWVCQGATMFHLDWAPDRLWQLGALAGFLRILTTQIRWPSDVKAKAPSEFTRRY